MGLGCYKCRILFYLDHISRYLVARMPGLNPIQYVLRDVGFGKKGCLYTWLGNE